MPWANTASTREKALPKEDWYKKSKGKKPIGKKPKNPPVTKKQKKKRFNSRPRRKIGNAIVRKVLSRQKKETK